MKLPELTSQSVASDMACDAAGNPYDYCFDDGVKSWKMCSMPVLTRYLTFTVRRFMSQETYWILLYTG